MHPLLYRLREQLLQLTPAARRRVEISRILLVDLRFQDIEFWTALSSKSQQPAAGNKSLPCFPRRGAANLSRSTLTLAWHALLTSPEIAWVALGMNCDVARIISTMGIADLERIARSQFDELMPRWADLHSVWRELLQAAQVNDSRASRFATLHALQLAAAEPAREN
jgi:hypothetical protein